MLLHLTVIPYDKFICLAYLLDTLQRAEKAWIKIFYHFGLGSKATYKIIHHTASTESAGLPGYALPMRAAKNDDTDGTLLRNFTWSLNRRSHVHEYSGYLAS